MKPANLLLILIHKFSILFFLISFTSLVAFAQENDKQSDDRINTFFIKFNGGVSQPGGNLAERFGWSGLAGGGVYYKTNKNWILGAEFDYIFGENVKEDSILSPISTSTGGLIGSNGNVFTPSLQERGYRIQIGAGKILPFLSPNDNSGLLIQGNVGFIQHKINYFLTEKTVLPQINGEYAKGYDRLTNGISFSEYVGYYHMSKNKLINFTIGFELTQAFTKNRREMNFDTMQRDESNRLDMLYSIKGSWILPLYKAKKAPEFYY